jgi:hypothetical protein
MSVGNLMEDTLAMYLLVGFVCAFRVTNLSEEVVFFLENEVLRDRGQSLRDRED